jgi:two-component system cell cycle sensor histidine kinase/response regulator CckA
MVENIPAMLWTTDLEYRITSLAGAGLAPLGISAGDHLGRSVSIFFQQSETNSKPLDAHFLAAGGDTCSFEIEMRGRDLHAHVEPLRGAGGEILGVIGVAVDDTDRLVAHRALRISEQSYRSLIEEAPHAICRCTASGSLLQVNRAMLEMLCCPESDLLVRSLQWEIFAEPEKYNQFLDELRKRKPCQGFETQWLRLDGQPVSVSLGGRAVCDASGEISYMDVIAENISERKQLEEQLRQAQKMQAVGQLAGGIAHDFNNLLTVIRGQTEMMAADVPASDPLHCRLEEVERAAERATTLTRQLLAFSRRQVLQTKVLDLNTVVANMNQMLARLIGENIELTFLPDPNLWQIKVDPGQIEQVLMNLAVNARDAMPQGGWLTIETENVRVDSGSRSATAVPPGEYVRLSFRDTGHGMDEDTKARIFEPFFTTKQVGKGTGLGLSVVYGVVKQSGGYVQVDSGLEIGTVFRIFLPRANDAAEEASKPASMNAAKGTETILFVEDDEGIRELVADFLRSHGYCVLTASDGADALRLAHNQRHNGVRLLLTDVVMPKMGGRELAESLRKSLPELKVVFVSGYPGDHDLGLEASRFVQKPFSMQILAGAIRQALDGELSN